MRIDGLEQPATWGNWWYPLDPGTHTVEVDFNTVPPGFAAPQRITGRCEFEVRAGEVAAVRADAHLNVDRGPGETGPVQVRDGLLYVEPEEFQAEWMDDPVKRLAYWKTPV
ncbi:hypothetical protein AB0B28_02200 [Glycomyces sp. NPDC046736]|uniref:hypothetical protein n=1 Tax=Glycomyces sp. NPDC046736 TaxID=3155615 RepID=UPI0033F9F08D